MGCITKHYLNEFSILGVWKIEEDLNTLLELASLDNDDKIVYNKNNKPFLKDGSRFISISHSHKLTSILLSTNEKVGIDLEYMSSNIAAIAFKFINRKEKVTKELEERRYHLYIHWCAKEALYKICDKEGISIRNNITIDPFLLKESGEITGHVNTNRINESFELYYSKYDNYAIVWTKKNWKTQEEESLQTEEKK